MSASDQTAADVRAGFCAILGLPNVGKSTLLNQALGVRLVAVSPKPQTTRNRIVGIHNFELPPAGDEHDDDGGPRAVQLVFVDTPGIQRGGDPLRRYMREQALAAAGECDLALLLVDVSDPRQRTPDGLRGADAEAMAEMVAATRVPIVLGLNKIDRLGDKRELLPILAAYGDTGAYAEIVPVSAKTGDGVATLERAVARRLPVGPRLFPEDMVTDRAERFLAAELIREQLFLQLGQELPYAAAVTVEELEDRSERGDVVIGAVIHVERDSQKGIVVGKGGQRIKEVGARAREAISQLFGCPVHLRLFVRVTDNWSRGRAGLRDMGYE
jgi:GTPase